MPDPVIIVSPLSCRVEKDGGDVEVQIYRLKDTEWIVKVIGRDGAEYLWSKRFASDVEAKDDVINIIFHEGFWCLL